MSTATVTDVVFEAGEVIVRLPNGRVARAPVDRFPRLQEATDEQRASWQLCGAGTGMHWPDIDEDVSVASLLCA